MSDIYSYRSDYPDRAQPDWVRVLPLPGRPIQSAELLEMQSIWMGHLKAALGTLYRSGTPLSGLRLINTNTASTPNYFVTPGVILIDGLALPVAGKELGQLDITKTHYVYVDVNEQVITELDDPNLRDPAHGGALYGLEGAHRLTWRASVVLNPDPIKGFKIAEIQEGRIIQAPLTLSYQPLVDLMATYTYERMGNFLVKGLSVSHSHSVPGQDVSSSVGQEIREAINAIRVDISGKRQELADLNVSLRLTISVSEANLIRQQIENLAGVIKILEEDLSTLTNQLSSYPEPKPAQEVFLISPGVAYIMGYRVNRPHSEVLAISRNTYKREAISARYVYSPVNQTTTREVTGSGNELVVTIDGLRGVPLTSIKVTSSNLQPADILLDYLVASFRGGYTFVTWEGEGYSSDALRSLVVSQLAIERISTNSIKFSLIYSRDLVSISTSGAGLNQTQGLLVSLSSLLPIKKYELAVKPVADITRVVADLLVDTIPITRTSNPDYLGDDTVLQVYRVEQGRTIYIQGQDYTLQNNSINWLEGGPELGTTYYVSFSYTQPLEPEDYRLVGDSVEFIGRTPMPGGMFTVDYEYYLAQNAIVYLDKEGILSYLISPPSSSPVTPVLTDDLLPLALIKLAGTKPIVEPFTYYRLTPQLLNKVWTLANSLIEGRNPVNLNLINQATSNYSLVGRPTEGITVQTHLKNVPLKYLGGASLYSQYQLPNVISLPLSSSEPTKSILPDGADQPQVTSYITLTDKGWPYIEATYRLSFRANYINPLTITPGKGQVNDQNDQYSAALIDGNSLFPEDLIETPTPLLINGICLDPSASYSLWVNSQRVNFTTLSGFTTALGVRPNGLGTIQLQAELNLRPGTHLIELRPSIANLYTPSTSLSLFSPLDNQLGGTPPYVTNPLTKSPSYQPNSLSQTFKVRRPRFITGVQLRFRTISGVISLILRDESSGLSLAHGAMRSGTPPVSLDGTAVTLFQFREPVLLLPDVLYGLVLVLESGQVQVYTAKLGEEGILTKQVNYLGAQVYNGGHLYLPGNVEAYDEDLTYTLDLAEFLPEPLVIQLGEYGLPDMFVGITAMAVNTRDICPLGTRVIYEYSTLMESGWKELVANQYTPLSSPVDKFRLRALLYTSTKYLSPLVGLGGASVSLYSHKNLGLINSVFITLPGIRTLLVTVKWEGVGQVLVNYSHSNGTQGPMSKTSTLNGSTMVETFSIRLQQGEASYGIELVSNRNQASPPILRSLSHELQL